MKRFFMNSKRIAAVFAAVVLLSLSAASASHLHEDLDHHPDCQLCLISGKSVSDLPKIFSWPDVFSLSSGRIISVSDLFRKEILYTNNSPQAPPSL